MNKNQEIKTENIRVSYETDDGIGARACLGFIILANDATLSYELHKILNIPKVSVYETRQEVSEYSLLTKEALEGQKNYIANAAKTVNARQYADVVAYGCTSGAMALGNNVIAQEVHKYIPNAKVTNPLLGAIEAFRALDVKKVAFFSPYIEEVNNNVIKCFWKAGIEVPVAVRFYEEGKNPTKDAPFISPQSIEETVLKVGKEYDVDAVFVSCTQMRLAEIAESVERKLGKRVITSNLALIWHTLRLAGCEDKIEGFGKLFESQLKS